MEFKEYKLSELGKIYSGGTPSTKKNEYWNGEVAWITPRDLSDHKGKYISKGSRNITQLGMKKSSAVLMPKGTILMSSRAPIGYIVIANNEVSTNQGFKSIYCNPEICNNDYLYYWLLNNVENIKASANGSTFKEISGENFKKIKVLIPSLENQNKIVKILSDIDKKIDLNNKINDNLQRISRELYKKWFIDFDFPNENGEPYKSSGGKMIESNFDKIPEGWEISNLKKILKRKNNKISNYESWKNLQLIDLSVMPQFDICLGEFNSASTMISNIYKLEKKDILYGSIRPYFGKAGVSPIDGAVTGTVFCYDSKITTHYEFLLLMTTSNKFIDYTIRLSKGTKMPIISWHDFIEYKFPMPNEEVLESFSCKISPLINEIINNMLINNQLKMMRDLLLPKLMNGDIDLENINE